MRTGRRAWGRIELTLLPYFELNMEEFHGEEVSEDPHEVKPQHLAPNDATPYHMQLVNGAASDSVDPALDAANVFDFTVTWTDPDSRDARVDEVSSSLAELLDADARELIKANVIIDLAQALTEVWDLEEGD